VWVFDVDGCIIDSLTGTSLRPGARELLEHLRAGHGSRVVVWSAGGGEYAERRARQLGIDHLADGFHAKEHRDGDGRYRTDHFLAEPGRAVFVDDRPEDLPVGARVVAVSPYLAANPHDRGLDPAARLAGLTLG
jgi:long-chain acyl-CoA synthetase